MTYRVNYNERSWAIDVIGCIKTYLDKKNKTIQDAGGEQTLSTEGGSLFPDVLLFGDKKLARILQGWELKMPDTPINDKEFIENAAKKAEILGLDSFLLWNVTYAHLYLLDHETKKFILYKEWDDLHTIKSRKEVQNKREEWEKLIIKIIDDLNNLFEYGKLEGKRFIDAYRSGGITSFIFDNSKHLEEKLEKQSKKDSKFRSELLIWGSRYKSEYGGREQKPVSVLSRVILSNWIGKFLFAHILSGFDQRAHMVFDIIDETTPNEALDIFKEISENCNFWTIFSDSLGLDLIPTYSWNHILQFNNLLKDLNIGAIDQKQLSDILESTVDVSVRKLRGQYPTPYVLAKLLVLLAVKNPESGRVLDPCSGSGTIIRAALEQKIEATGRDNTSKLIFASDQDHQANQITTFALTKPELINLPIRVFNQDVFNLHPQLDVRFRDPRNGKEFIERLGVFDSIISNFPFVSQDGRKQYKEAIEKVSSYLDNQGLKLSNKSDVFAYIPFSLYPLLNENGILGIIISNAWLGTDWGDEFFNILTQFYHLKTVVTSGAGRWFQNSEIVTNILILEKKKDLKESLETNFIILKKPLCDLEDQDNLLLVAAQIELGSLHDGESLSIHNVTLKKIKKFSQYGLRGTMQFISCDWILDLPLIPLNNILSISRGERRGWNEMFYPEKNHGIENKYIKSVLRNSKGLKGYLAYPDQDAFSCSEDIDILEKYYPGAYNWIKKFENAKNTDNIPLPVSLARPKMHWYEMNSDKLSDFVFSINFNKRLFISKFTEPSFADQRLVCMKVKEQYVEDIDLIHAILNSAITYLFIEGMFFGKGLGALDLNQSRFKKYMHILDPLSLSPDKKKRIKELFTPLLNRDVEDIYDELEILDRKKFDQCILDSFNINIPLEQIYSDLLNLVDLRQTSLQCFD